MIESRTAIRAAAVAGVFYPAFARDLSAEVERLIESGLSLVAAGAAAPKAVVVPHAGYPYSGEVAAHAYALLRRTCRGRTRRVVLLGPAHRVAVRGLALPSVCAFRTPLGTVALDVQGCAVARQLPQVVTSDQAHALEHSLEVQLPFLQAALGDFSLVPLVVGRASPAEVAKVIEALWDGDETLIVISSDLSHYLGYEEARAADARTVAAIEALDGTLGHEQACGATPVNAMLACARVHGLKARVLDLRNSGDTAGPRDRVVGYCSIAFDSPEDERRGNRVDEAAASPPRALDAPGAEDAVLGAALLARARNAISRSLGEPLVAEPAHDLLAAPGATFVTLTLGGALRGCIGSLQVHRTLERDVQENALAAAFRDPRFAPLARGEFRRTRVEVSLLGPARPLPVRDEAHACAALRPHRDGVILDWRGRRATFLPQVWESLPDPAEFLRQLKRKAGLAEDFWADDLALSRYEVVKWQEPAGERS